AITADAKSKSFTKAITAVVEILEQLDLNEQSKDIQTSIISGHQAIIIAHSQGNFFTNKVYKDIQKDNPWAVNYIKVIAVASPANEVPNGGASVTFDNDPIRYIPDAVGDTVVNPMRYVNIIPRIEDEAKYHGVTLPCVGGVYFFDDYGLQSCLQQYNFNADYDDKYGEFHAFAYYMTPSLSAYGFMPDDIVSKPNPAYSKIITSLNSYINTFKTAASQWKLKKKNKCPTSCSDQRREIEHKYSKSVNDMAFVSQLGVYPFSENGKLYPLDGWYAGSFIMSSGSDMIYAKASSVEGEVLVMGNTLESSGVCYELRTIENNQPASFLDRIKKEDIEEPTKPTGGYVEVSIVWENKDVDLDLEVHFPGEHDIKDECQLFEHFYSPDINYKYVGEGLYPVYVRYEADDDITSNQSLMEMMDIIVSIKVPGHNEARTVSLKVLDSLPSNGHIADIKVEEAKVEVVLEDDFRRQSTVISYHSEGGNSGSSNSGFGGGGGTVNSNGGWSYNYTPIPPGKDYIYSIIWHISQALLGPLTGANISVYALEDYDLVSNRGSNPIYTDVSSYGSSIYTAGIIAAPREILDSLDDKKLYIVEARGGLDIDVNDDKVVDAAPTINTGATRALTSGSALKNIGFKINILTEMAYQVSKKYYDANDLSKLIDKSDEVLRCLLNDDINLDNVTNTIDALYFTPYNDKYSVYQSYNDEFMPIIRKIHKNEDIYDSAFGLYARPLVQGGYFSTNEDAPVGTIIGKINTDCVSESPVHLFTLSGTGSENFEVDSEGNLKVAKQLVYEDRRIYNLQVVGANAYGNSPRINVYITVTADNSPIITTSSLTTYAIENMPEGTSIGGISINDMGYPLTSVRLEGDGAEYFSIDNSGNVRVAQGNKIDVKDKVYNLRAIATNAFGDSASVPIKIDIYDDIPVIVSNIYAVVEDIAKNGSFVTRAQYYQGLSQIQEFKLEGYGAENFDINSVGAITVSENANLSIGSSLYYLQITAVNEQGESEPKTVTIQVISIDSSTISLHPFSANIYVDSKNGSVLGGIYYSYNFYSPTNFTLSGAGSERFSIDSNGRITLIDNSNLAIGDVFSFEAMAYNEYTTSKKSQVSITVVDDFLSLYKLGISIVEGLDAGTAIGKVGYSYGVNPPISFELLGDEANDFSIDDSGTIRVKNILNYDVKQRYAFNVKATSDSGKSATSTVTVNIIDDAPVLRDTTLNIMENSYGGEVLGYVTVSSSGRSQIISYALSGEGTEHFSIDDKGLIRVGIGAKIDYETRDVYHLKATAANSYDTSNEVNITINVVNAPDQEPVLISTTLHIDENSPAGTVVGSMAVYSEGMNGIVSFIMEGTNSDWFDIDNMGKITVNENAVLDYESKNVFNLKVKAIDSYGWYSALTDLVINLNDLPDTPPTIRAAQFYIDENSPKDFFVGQLQIYGAGAPITSIDLMGKGSENFKVYNNGTIVVENGVDLDYEKETYYSLTATVSNEFFTSNAVNVYIFINNLPDNPPRLSDAHYSIYKETLADKVIGSVKAVSYIHCDIQRYVISDNSVFGIKDNGQIYTKVVTSETNYTLNVYAVSSCGNSNTVKLTIDTKNRIVSSISLSDTYDVTLSSDNTKAFVADWGGGLKIIDVSDPIKLTPLGLIGASSAPRAVALSLDNTKAFVTTNSGLEIIDINNPIKPTLLGSISMSDTFDVVLSSDNTKAFVTNRYNNLEIIDVSNPANPTLLGSIGMSYAHSIALSSDNTKAFVADGSGGLKIIDVNNPANPTLLGLIGMSYAYGIALSSDNTKAFVADWGGGLKIIDVSNPAKPILLDSVSMTYTRAVALSSDSTKAFVAADKGLKIIDIEDFMNDQVSPIIQNGLVFEVDENSLSGTFVGQLNVYNADTMSLSGVGNGDFEIYSNGTIVVADGANLDYESKNVYSLSAIAYNEFGVSNSVNVVVNINNVPDTPSVVQNSIFYVDENSLSETFVGQLNIDDHDSPIMSIVLSGSGAENFKAYNNGTIVVAEGANLDYEAIKSYTLYVIVYNEFGASNNASMVVNINNVPDTPPVVQNSIFYVDENSLSETFVGQLNINDDGSPVMSIVLSGQRSENFKAYNNGTIVVAEGASIDYESKNVYSLSAIAYNEFGASNTATVQINITDTKDTLPVLQDVHFSIHKATPVGKTIGVISIASTMHCEIERFVIDNDSVFDIKDNGEIYVKAALSKNDYALNVHAASTCGDSNTINLTIDTESKVIDSINMLSYAQDVALSSDNTKVFVATDYGLNIIDISDPVNLFLLGSASVPNAQAVALSSDDTRVFMVDFYNGLKIIDVSNPTNPAPLGSMSISYAYGVTLSSDNTKVFVTDSYNGLNIIDVSNPIKPELLSSTQAFAANSYSSLNIINANNFANPILLSMIDMSYAQDIILSADNTKAFIADHYNGLKIIDVSNPTNPVPLGLMSMSRADGITLSSDNTKVFIADSYNGLNIIDVSDPAKPTLLSVIGMSYANDVTLSSDNTKAFVADGSDGLNIIDVSDPAKPTLLGSIRVLDAQAVALSLDNTKAFVAAGGNGLKIIDIEDFISDQVPPAIQNGLVFEVDENSLGGTFVGQLAIYNLDSVTSIELSGEGAENFKAYSNGTIVVAEGAKIDYEAVRSYTLSVIAYNDFGTSSSINIKININDLSDTPPAFEDFTQYFWVDENSLEGTFVGQLIMYNLDSVTSIVLSGEGAEKFRVDNNGTIVVANRANFNYESASIYSLSIVAYNEFGASNTGYIFIFVNNIPNPYISNSWFGIDEHSTSETVVGKLTIDDYGSPITSVYIEGAGSENFDISLDGTIKVVNGAALDYETKQYYNFRVFATNEYGKSNGATVSIYLYNIPDSPPMVSGAIINLDKSAQAGDEVGYLYIYADGSGVDSISLSGAGSDNFNIVLDNYCDNYSCYSYMHVSENANLEYFNEGAHKIYVSASNEFGSSSAAIWIVAGKGSKISPPEFNNITFVTFGDAIEEGDTIGMISASSKIHCEITDYFIDDDRFGIEMWEEYAEIIANEFVESDKVYHLNLYADSVCGASNNINVTIDTKNRISTFETEYYMSSLTLADNETKLFVNSREFDSIYMLDLGNSENSHYLDLRISEDTKILPPSAVSKDGKYLYVTTANYNEYGYGESYDFNIYDINSIDNPILVGSTKINEVGNEEWCDAKTIVSKNGDKVFLQNCNGIQIIDVNNPYLPTVVSKIISSDENAIASMSMSKDEKIIYATTYDNFGLVMQRYDISSLHAPIKLAPISFANAYVIIGMSDDNTLVYVSGEYGLVTYDISNANNPVLVNLYDGLLEYYYPSYMNTPVTLNNNRLLISDKIENPFTIFDFSDPIKPYVSAIKAQSAYRLGTHRGFIATSNKSKVFTAEGDILMIDIEGIGE
ncbi:MAG: cadherin domain-containing protein, partial [Campylobacteraceae bacterium]|nr:cadherin domain-containing protein [Campylobacteraceae bacterium]